MKWNKKNTYIHTYVLGSIKTLKMNKVFIFTDSRHLYLHDERVRMEGGGHVAPPRVYSGPERGSPQGRFYLGLTAHIRKIITL